MKIKLTKIFLGLFLATLLVPFGMHAAVSGQGLTISPPISDITLDPGQTVTRTIKINNPTGNLIEVYPRVMNFKASGETGEPAFYDVGDGSEKFALANWISFNQAKLALAPEQIVEFTYAITVPSDAEPGGHYGAVFFANEPQNSNSDTSNVNMGSMIGSLLLVRVPGQVIEKGAVESFNADKLLYFDNKVSFSTRISNLGNVHFKPLGNVVVRDIFGREVDTITFNDQGGNVLPDSIRKYETSWQPNKFLFGYYKVDLKATYGQGGQSLTGVTSFWVLPIWFLILAAIVIILLIALIVWILIHKKGHKKNRPKPPIEPQRPLPPRPPVSEPKGPIILR